MNGDEVRRVLKPFAKAGELFLDENPEFDSCVYRPAAGDEYSISGSDLARARALLARLKASPVSSPAEGEVERTPAPRGWHWERQWRLVEGNPKDVPGAVDRLRAALATRHPEPVAEDVEKLRKALEDIVTTSPVDLAREDGVPLDATGAKVLYNAWSSCVAIARAALQPGDRT